MVEPSIDAPLVTRIEVHASRETGLKTGTQRNNRDKIVNNFRFMVQLLFGPGRAAVKKNYLTSFPLWQQ
jgi:hypothetical protein